VRLGVFGAFGLEWFDVVVPHFVLHILLVNFSWIVSASGCRHILPNHLNLGVFVAVLFLYSALFYFIVDLGIPHLSQHLHQQVPRPIAHKHLFLFSLLLQCCGPHPNMHRPMMQ
jgi:drug/metabolite transporter (DMT)-like permease